MSRKSIADLAYDILEENRRPMHYRKITEEVMKISDIKAEKPHHGVNALMGADQRFVRYQRGIWGLLKWKYREANLPYSLTSYCLHNGTIFLTNYLKPYFAGQQGEQLREATFIDSEGEEINVVVDYRKKTIIGLKEWFQKKALEVNDTILLGLIDQSKKIYFIIAQKEIEHDTEKDIGDKIYKILRIEDKPLSFSQIYSEITQQEPGPGNLLEKYLRGILDEDNRFAKTNKEQWGLLEWLDESERLFVNLGTEENIEDYHISLQKCFNFLGYNTEFVEKYTSGAFLARAELASKSYSLIITGLLNNYDNNIVYSIDWSTLKKVKKDQNADSVILFSEEFILPGLIERASEEGVQLYELAILEYIIKEHGEVPFSLVDLRLAFSPLHTANNNLVMLQRIRRNQWQSWQLLKMIISILQAVRTENTFIDINLLTKKLNNIGKTHNKTNIESAQVKKAVTVLSKEPLKLLELSESGSIILAYPDHLAREKVSNILQYIIGNPKN
ncbi:MAG: hypothetical protein GX240_01310 [Candidatus Atribacteria bacterium]|nr:hypothetical protein [Candidatus Atribacteria bacterium]